MGIVYKRTLSLDAEAAVKVFYNLVTWRENFAGHALPRDSASYCKY